MRTTDTSQDGILCVNMQHIFKQNQKSQAQQSSNKNIKDIFSEI